MDKFPFLFTIGGFEIKSWNVHFSSAEFQFNRVPRLRPMCEGGTEEFLGLYVHLKISDDKIQIYGKLPNHL
jgi:hypothetical protein